MRLIEVSVLKEWVENWFTKNRFYHPYSKGNNIPITELYDILEQMPSAQPERKTGKWERHYTRPNVYADLYWHCSQCGYKNDNQYADRYHNFCPNCGADMRGEQK